MYTTHIGDPIEKTFDQTRSPQRRQLLALASEYQQLVAALPRRGSLVRGALNLHTRDSGRYPGVIRTVGGRMIGRRVRMEHVAWLEPLLVRHKAYRQAEAQLRRVHARILALAEQTRLYDYEPKAVTQALEGRRPGVRMWRGNVCANDRRTGVRGKRPWGPRPSINAAPPL